MDTVNLGATGLKVSKLCLGCMTYGSPQWRPWVLDEDASRPFFRQAFEAGINFFDTADMYSAGESERVLGAALREYGAASSTWRDEVVIATKVFFPNTSPASTGANAQGLSRKRILSAIDRSLKNLGVDYVDLYQIHRFDPQTPIEETLEALNDVVRAGKARYIGASSMFAWQFARMLSVSAANGWARFVSMQPQLNLVYREEEREMLPLCQAEGIGVIPWSPLARGFLAGRSLRPGEGETARARSDEFSPKLYYQDADFAVVEAVKAVAAARGVSPTQVALAWVLRHPGVTAPIVGASKPHHLDEAVAALALTLTPEEVAALEAPYRPKPVLDHT